MSTRDCGDDCEEALDKLHRFLDGELDEAHVETISAHLAQCYPCAERKHFEEQLRAIVRERCVEKAPQSLYVRIHGYLSQQA